MLNDLDTVLLLKDCQLLKTQRNETLIDLSLNLPKEHCILKLKWFSGDNVGSKELAVYFITLF